jgi:hypothetical protein
MNILALHSAAPVEDNGQYSSQSNIVNTVLTLIALEMPSSNPTMKNHTDDRTPDLLLKEPYYR